MRLHYGKIPAKDQGPNLGARPRVALVPILKQYLKVFHSGYNPPTYDNFEDLESDQSVLWFLQLHILSNLIVVFHVPSILELFMALHHVKPFPR